MHFSWILRVAIVVAVFGSWSVVGHNVLGATAASAAAAGDHRIRSRCPGVFEFRVRHDYYIYGLLTIPSPPLRRHRVPLLVTFQLRARLPTKYGGLIELRRSQNDTVRDIQQRRPIQFIIHLPLQSPLPQLTLILFDNVVLCDSGGSHHIVSPSVCVKIRDGNCCVPHELAITLHGYGFHGFDGAGGSEVMPTFTTTRPVVNRIEFRYAFNTTQLDPVSGTVTTATAAFKRRPDFNEPPIDANGIETDHIASADGTTTTPWPTIATTRRTRFNASRQRCGELHKNFTSTPTAAVIRNRAEMERGSWPWLTAIYNIQSTVGPRFLCAGTLVSPTLVVTASSCLASKEQNLSESADQLLVMLGRHNMTVWFEMDTVNRLVRAVHVPDARLWRNADIAVLVLSEHVEYGPFVQPLCLWRHFVLENEDGKDNGDDVDEITTLENVGTVVGWGSDAHGQPSSSVPFARTITILPTALCGKEAVAAFERGWQHNFCAGARNVDGSYGDCGGHVGSGFVVLQNDRLALRGVMAAASVAAVTDAKDGETRKNMCVRRNYYSFADVGEMEQWIEGFLE